MNKKWAPDQPIINTLLQKVYTTYGGAEASHDHEREGRKTIIIMQLARQMILYMDGVMRKLKMEMDVSKVYQLLRRYVNAYKSKSYIYKYIRIIMIIRLALRRFQSPHGPCIYHKNSPGEGEGEGEGQGSMPQMQQKHAWFIGFQ